MEETSSFLQSLIASHGPNYLEKLFGSKARDALAPLGGVEKVAIALSGNYSSLHSLSPPTSGPECTIHFNLRTFPSAPPPEEGKVLFFLTATAADF